MLYVYNALRAHGNDMHQWLAIRSLATGAEQRLDISALIHASSLGPFILASMATGRGVVWARNGTVFLPANVGRAVLLTLKER